MRSASDRITSRVHVLCGLVLWGFALCGFAGLTAIGCTKAQIESDDASGQAGASGGSGGSGGTSAGGRGGSAAAGTGGGAAGSTAGAGGTDAGGRGGTGAAGTTGSAGTTGGSGGGGGGRGGMGGSSGGAAGTGPGGAGGMSGAGGTMTGGRGGATAGTTGSGGATAGTTGSGGATAGATGSGGASAGTTGSGGASAGATGSGGSGGGTPVTPTVAGQIVVTELMHDTDVVGDDFGEWFEIYNPSDTASYDLNGCQIRDLANTHTIAAHLTLPPHAFRTLAIFATGGGFVPDYTYSGIKFDNSAADEVNIYCGGTLIDRFAYSASLATVSGHAFSVDPAHYNAVDNDNPSNYCLAQMVYNQGTSGTNIIRDYGTPGVTNPSCP